MKGGSVMLRHEWIPCRLSQADWLIIDVQKVENASEADLVENAMKPFEDLEIYVANEAYRWVHPLLAYAVCQGQRTHTEGHAHSVDLVTAPECEASC